MMRYSLIFLCLSFSSVQAQNWKTIFAGNYHASSSFIQLASGFQGHNKQFHVNPYNNSIWFGWKNEVQGFDPNGTYFHYDDINTPLFNSQSLMVDFVSTSEYTFSLDRNYGLYKFNGISWSSVSVLPDGIDISVDEDSVWVSRLSNNYYQWTPSSMNTGTITAFKRIESKNGIFWGSSSTNNFISLYENGTAQTYSPDTSALLDFSNNDFKFSKTTDSLYVAGSLGISVAFNGGFWDTITPNNTVGMPSPSVFEIELDSQNNIWAVFGTSHIDVSHVGYLNRATGIWEQIYNENNSPIDFSYRVSIELDSADNLYVVDTDLHILEVTTLPGWLGSVELENKTSFSIFPNPVVDGKIQIKKSDNLNVSEIQIKDLSGRNIKSLSYTQEIILDLPSGTYFLDLKNNETLVGTKKFVVL